MAEAGEGDQRRPSGRASAWASGHRPVHGHAALPPPDGHRARHLGQAGEPVVDERPGGRWTPRRTGGHLRRTPSLSGAEPALDVGPERRGRRATPAAAWRRSCRRPPARDANWSRRLSAPAIERPARRRQLLGDLGPHDGLVAPQGGEGARPAGLGVEHGRPARRSARTPYGRSRPSPSTTASTSSANPDHSSRGRPATRCRRGPAGRRPSSGTGRRAGRPGEPAPGRRSRWRGPSAGEGRRRRGRAPPRFTPSVEGRRSTGRRLPSQPVTDRSSTPWLRPTRRSTPRSRPATSTPCRLLWEHSDRIVCTHPGWASLRGWGQVAASFFALFQNSQHLQFILTKEKAEVAGDVGWVTVDENILQTDERHHGRRPQPVRPGQGRRLEDGGPPRLPGERHRRHLSR